MQDFFLLPLLDKKTQKWFFEVEEPNFASSFLLCQAPSSVLKPDGDFSFLSLPDLDDFSPPSFLFPVPFLADSSP